MSYTIPKHRTGDTWKGIKNITIFRMGSALNLLSAVAKMQVRNQTDAPHLIEFSSKNGTIVFTDAENGVLMIPEVLVDIPVGNYLWDLQITLSSGEVKTFIGGNWNIIPDITK
jgi:hypothetical protein